ncbi:iron dicitrate transporter FecR [Thalassotalea insulae]|uniref:Iron dicitrate transporter FecR n=1 Tax=Thalassotalea insulae TaxID=2056778 RepID=A0ABQ6GT17_9GAMM|nr:FecR domain-containing protein [Thalassotalea insulae]GLX79062.1 iron dicitrate transporter FecR [Thalassotalea insulae]
MSNIHQFHEHSQLKQEQQSQEEQILAQASDWIAKLDRGLSNDEQYQLQQWLALDNQHVEVLFEVAQLWDKMDELSRLADLFPPSQQQKTFPKWLGAVAASVIVMLTLGIYYAGFQSSIFGNAEQASVVAKQMHYQTQVGESSTINLPDNSKMVLNTNSFVQITYTPAARVIELQRGEIHIDVAHDKSRPLSVVVGGKVIQAVGTAFNVEVRNELVELIVTDGKVLVAEQPLVTKDNDVTPMTSRLPASSMAISKGEKVDLDLTGQKAEQVVKVDAGELAASLSWRQGNLIFRGEQLADAMAEISRYTDIEFELSDDEKLRQVQVAGMFKTGDVNGLLDVLNRNFNISYQRVANDKILLKFAG